MESVVERSEPAEENARLARIVRSCPEAIVGENADGLVTSWNRAAVDLYGYQPDDILGRPADLLYPAAYRAEEAAILRRAAREDPGREYHARRIRRDGSALMVSVRAWSIVDDVVPDPGHVSVSSEVAGRRDDGWPAEMGHRLRTPLQAIIGFTGTLLLRMPGPLNEEQERQLLLIQASGQKMLALINDLGW